MATTDLLTAVLAPEGEGWYCIVGLRQDDARPKQSFHQTLAEAETEIADLLQDKNNVYFACAKYKDPKEGRVQPNGDIIKAFWVDIDCGEGKPYADQTIGLNALKQFCKKINMPLPSVVNSGRGIHAYWRLKTVITRAEWRPVAERLKALCEEHGFDADPSRTADNASILRVSETLNFKEDPPLAVDILKLQPEIDYEYVKQTIGVLVAPDWMPRQYSESALALLGNKQSRFKTIMIKTMNGEGCAQLENIAINQDTIEEPLWRAGLSVAAVCVDRDEAIHKISDGHPEYSPESTERKANQTKGPYTCQTFEKLNPQGCEGCQYKGKISSPVQLGSEIAAAETNVIVEQSEEGQEEVFDIPPYPFPYFRGKNGGVYLEIRDDDGGSDAINIYEHDLYIVKRLHDPAKGESVWIRLHLPKDGMKEFAMSATDAMTAEKLRDKLGYFGVIAAKKQMDAIMGYMIASAKNLQHSMELEIMRDQFGWADKDKKFIIGEQEVSAEKVAYSPPSVATGSLADHLKPKGSFEEWQRIVKVYDQPGFEPHAFGFFTAFGAPLLKHLKLKGAIINLVNNISGTGKSTILKMCNSVWGHPEELMLQWKDTTNAMLHRLGIMNNLPVTIDEVTKMSGDHFSDLLYAASQGRGKNRMKQHENAERINTTKWGTMVLTSSNASFYDKLATLKATPDGEFMRLLEYKIELTGTLTKQEAEEIFNALYEHHGHAGVKYAQYLVTDLEEVMDLVMQVQQRIDKAVDMSNRERFWSAVAACNIAGALIAKDLGIIDFDIHRVYTWIVSELKVMRHEIKAPTKGVTDAISEFINEHRGTVLVINDEVDGRTGMEQLPIVEPRWDKLYIRIEPDTKEMYINAKQFRKYCTENQITLKDVLTALEVDKAYLGLKKKRISKGTKIKSGAIDCFAFDLSAKAFEEEQLIEIAQDTPQDADPRAELQS